MSFLKKITSIFSPGGGSKTPMYWVYVQCNRCNEKLRTNVNLNNDLSIRYAESNSDDTYFTHKTIIGRNLCFQPIEVELSFDRQRNLVDKQIQGGRFITEEEFAGKEEA